MSSGASRASASCHGRLRARCARSSPLSPYSSSSAPGRIQVSRGACCWSTSGRGTCLRHGALRHARARRAPARSCVSRAGSHRTTRTPTRRRPLRRASAAAGTASRGAWRAQRRSASTRQTCRRCWRRWRWCVIGGAHASHSSGRSSWFGTRRCRSTGAPARAHLPLDSQSSSRCPLGPVAPSHRVWPHVLGQATARPV